MLDPKNRLKKLLSEGKVIPVLGAGVSMFASNLPGWGSLIKSGFNYLDNRYVKSSDIDNGLKDLEQYNFLDAGQKLREAFNNNSSLFTTWLKDMFAEPLVTDTSLHLAIEDLCCNFTLTTNYDKLIVDSAQIEKPEIFTHLDYEVAQNFLREKKPFIFHLHGVYSKPESIVLSKNDYENLNGNHGYKSFIRNLLQNYHFLFIGCSKEGLTDDDFLPTFEFMNNWFRNSSNEHFILFQQRDIEKENHKKLLLDFNIHPIVYGLGFGEQPEFIRKINPNLEIVNNKWKKFEYTVQQGIKRIGREYNLENFINENVTNYSSSKDRRSIIILEALYKYNERNKNLRDKLIASQIISKSFIDIHSLEEKIDLCNKNVMNAEPINNTEFISAAVFAFRCLNSIPKELVLYIKGSKFSTTFHLHFYSGYLQNFGKEAEGIIKSGEKVDSKDYYFFENLGRILTSLFHFISLDPDRIFPELKTAEIVSNLNGSILCVQNSSGVEVHDINSNTKLGYLPLDSGYDYFYFNNIKFENQTYIIGACSAFLYKWNPLLDNALDIFYKSETNSISCVDINVTSNEIKVLLQDDLNLVEIDGLKSIRLSHSINLNGKFYVTNYGIILNRTSSNRNENMGIWLYDNNMNKLDEITGGTLLEAIISCAELKNIYLSRFEPHNLLSSFINFIQDIYFYKIKDCQSKLILSITVDHGKRSSIIAIVGIVNNKFIIENLHHCHYSVSICADAQVMDEELVVACGYLNIGGNEVILELLTYNLNSNLLSSQPYRKPIKNHEIQDVFSVRILSKYKFLINIEGKEHYILDLLQQQPLKLINTSNNVSKITYINN